MRRIAIKLQYDGTDYLGWQLQAEGRTVQGVLEEAVRRATGAAERVPVQGAARTDAGVHAEGQVAHFDTACELPAAALVDALNFWLPADVAVLAAYQAGEAFHARFSAVAKLYRYRLLCSRQRRPLTERYCFRVPLLLDLGAMRACASQLVGTHDFSSFTSAGGNTQATTHTVFLSEWREAGGELHFLVKADGFSYKMVRALVGTMLDAGRGRLSPEDFAAALLRLQRRAAGPTAPARGLTLVQVFYPPAVDPFGQTQ